MQTDYEAFGSYVKRLREARGMTQEDLAGRSELAADTIRRLEHREFSPSLRTLHKLCKGLGISLGALFAGFEMSEGDPVYEALTVLLRGQQRKTLELILRLVRILIEHLEQPEAGPSS